MSSSPPTREPALRAVLLDMDGTLIDTADLVADSLAYASRLHLGYELPHAEYLRLVGRPAAVQMEILAPGRGRELAPDAMRFYEEHIERERPFPGAVEALAAIRAAGMKTALVTSKTRAELDPALERLSLGRYLDASVTADMTARPKPAPDPVLKALELLDATPQEALFIGDSPYDMAAGREAGVRTAAALWGPHLRERLADERPTYWLERPEEMGRLVQRLVGGLVADESSSRPVPPAVR